MSSGFSVHIEMTIRLLSKSLPSWEFVELPGHIDSCLSSNLGSFWPSFLQIFSLPLPLSSPGTAIVCACVSMLNGAPLISEAVLIFLYFFFLFLRLNNLNLPIFKFSDSIKLLLLTFEGYFANCKNSSPSSPFAF
mgnify:CR=1 FL=1